MLAANFRDPARFRSVQTAEGAAGHPDRPLRIALLGYRSSPFSGGQGIYIKHLSRALLEAGHQVDVISGPPYPDLDPRIPLIRIPSLDLYAAPNHVTALRPRHLLSWADTFEYLDMLTGGFPEPHTFGLRVLDHLRKHGRHYDIIHDNQCLARGMLRLQRLGFPLVTTVHHPITRDRSLALAGATDWKHRLLVRRWHAFLRMQRHVLRRLHHLVTVSEFSRQDIASEFGIDPARLTVVHNGIDTERFRPQPETARQPHRIMATASADVPLKGLDVLLRALPDIAAAVPDIELVVLGKLKPQGPTARLLGQLDLGNRVRFVSAIPDQAVARLYAEAALVVVPSLYEGFGLPAAEAMACGTPVISSDGGALPEVVGDAGVVVPAGNVPALARAVVDLLQDPSRRADLSRRGRDRIESLFSWSNCAKRMIDLYRQLPHVPLHG